MSLSKLKIGDEVVLYSGGFSKSYRSLSRVTGINSRYVKTDDGDFIVSSGHRKGSADIRFYHGEHIDILDPDQRDSILHETYMRGMNNKIAFINDNKSLITIELMHYYGSFINGLYSRIKILKDKP
jgi:hypothetical protein